MPFTTYGRVSVSLLVCTLTC